MVLNQKCQNKVKSYLRSSTAASSSSSSSATAKEGKKKKKSQGGWKKGAGAGTAEESVSVNAGRIHGESGKEKRATRLRLCLHDATFGRVFLQVAPRPSRQTPKV